MNDLNKQAGSAGEETVAIGLPRQNATMLSRYDRASQKTRPKMLASIPGVAVEGYWLTDGLYFFVADKLDNSTARPVRTPSVYDAEHKTVRAVIQTEELAQELSTQSGRTIRPADLSGATFDMPATDVLAVTTAGQNFLIDVSRKRVTTSSAALEQPALYSPDRRYACFLKGHNVWLRERDTGVERALTTDGVVNWVYGRQSEYNLEGTAYRANPFPLGLWSPDSKWFLTHRIDDRDVPDFLLTQHVPPKGGRPIVHQCKFSGPGDPMPQAVFVAIHLPSGRKIEFTDFSLRGFLRSPIRERSAWFGHQNDIWFVRSNLYSKSMELVRLDLENGSGKIVLSETTAWGYLTRNLLSLNVRTLSSGEVIWYSERDGWGHLYLFDMLTGELKCRITRGAWRVRDIVHVDEARRTVFLLTSSLEPNTDPARRSLCSVNLDGSGFRVLLSHDGDLFVPRTEPAGLSQDRPFRPAYSRTGMSPDNRFAIVRYFSVERGDRTEIVDFQQSSGAIIASAEPSPDEIAPRHFAALASDGTTRLHGIMFLPNDFNESTKYPLIDVIYPGPQVAWKPQSYRNFTAAEAMALAELGFITIMLDTRGIPVASRARQQAGYPKLLEPQVADHAAVVRQLCESNSFIDSERIGMMGVSAGGYATARALLEYGTIFKAGVSCCGNHNTDFNSATWSNRYRGNIFAPETKTDEPMSVAAHKLEGALLLVSGDMDENVHVSHTLMLADALIKANRDFELLIVPNAGHDVSGHTYAQRRIWDFFVRHLLGETPPQHYRLQFEPWELELFQIRMRAFVEFAY